MDIISYDSTFGMVLMSFITFNCFALLNNKEIRDIKWWLGYLMCCINYLFTYYIGRQLTIPVSVTNSFGYNDLLAFVPYVFISDAVFYFTHRLAHTKYLYKIHKQHHEWHEKPVSTSFLDSNPVEHFIVNVPTVVVPFYIIKISNVGKIIWVVLATTNSVIAHMTSLDEESPHILHHKLRRVNYGAGGFYLMDRMFRNI